MISHCFDFLFESLNALKKSSRLTVCLFCFVFFFFSPLSLFCFSYLSGRLQREEWKLLQTWRVCVSINNYEVWEIGVGRRVGRKTHIWGCGAKGASYSRVESFGCDFISKKSIYFIYLFIYFFKIIVTLTSSWLHTTNLSRPRKSTKSTGFRCAPSHVPPCVTRWLLCFPCSLLVTTLSHSLTHQRG